MGVEEHMMEPLLLPEVVGMQEGLQGGWACSHWGAEEGNCPGCSAPTPRTSLSWSSQSRAPPWTDLEHPACGKDQAWTRISWEVRLV